MEKIPNYVDQTLIQLHGVGIHKIGNRKYYCYIDGNDTVVVIPNWYRNSIAYFGIFSLVFGVFSGWAITQWLL